MKKCPGHVWNNGKCIHCSIDEAKCWECGVGIHVARKANTTPVFCTEDHRDKYVTSGKYDTWLRA